ncbi:MAG TPA: ABC transporter permease, partial [Candidatus Synoicihabitans sp.]|nr:ABC transporter permease [Candidatus Synoicihabitans sp.]
MLHTASSTEIPPAGPDLDHAEAGSSLWRDAWHRLARNKLAVFGGVMLLVLAIACIAGPWFLPYSYEQQDLDLGASAPSAEHWLGTDTLGR